MIPAPLDRRTFLQSTLAASAALLGGKALAQDKKPTNFQIACMTEPSQLWIFLQIAKSEHKQLRLETAQQLSAQINH